MSATINGRATPARSRPETRPRPRLHVAPDVARQRLRARLLAWGAIVFTVAALFVLVGFHVLAAQSAFRLDKLEKERTNEQYRYQRLREDVARHSSAESVIAAARALGMVEANNMTYLVAPPAAAPSQQGGSGSSALSTDSYDHTKPHLDPNP